MFASLILPYGGNKLHAFCYLTWPTESLMRESSKWVGSYSSRLKKLLYSSIWNEFPFKCLLYLLGKLSMIALKCLAITQRYCCMLGEKRDSLWGSLPLLIPFSEKIHISSLKWTIQFSLFNWSSGTFLGHPDWEQRHLSAEICKLIQPLQ